MLSKNLIKYINSLEIKKYRQEHSAFLVEGAKSVRELLDSDFEIELVASTEQFYKETITQLDKQPFRVEIATPDDLAKAGTLQTNDSALAVVKTRKNDFLCANDQEYVLVLDDIRDPGNLGTIIRVADWYGIHKIICSTSTTDWYNPKVIAASKGSFLRVKSFYTDLEEYFRNLSPQPPLLLGEGESALLEAPLLSGEGELSLPTGKRKSFNEADSPSPNRRGGRGERLNVLGTFFDGHDVHKLTFAPSGYIVMGNESNGISAGVETFVNQRITIPRYGGAESLNVGIATAVVLDNLRKNVSIV